MQINKEHFNNLKKGEKFIDGDPAIWIVEENIPSGCNDEVGLRNVHLVHSGNGQRKIRRYRDGIGITDEKGSPDSSLNSIFSTILT